MVEAKTQDLISQLTIAREQLKKAQAEVADLEAALALEEILPLAQGSAEADDGIQEDPITLLHEIMEWKQAESALNARLQEEREFQIYLKALHEITIELTQIDDLDAFYKRAVECGVYQLGFERLGLFLYDPQDGSVVGTYGVNVEGKLIQARHVRFVPDEHGTMARAFARVDRFYYSDNLPLYDDASRVGVGWNAASVLWNGTQRLGWFVADNLLSHAPASKPALDALGLYGLTVGHLLAQKQIELALRESEARYRHMTENAQDTIYRFRLHPEPSLEYVSPAVTTLIGYTPGELYEKRRLSYELLCAGDRPLLEEIQNSPARQNEPFVLRWRHKDGVFVWVEHRSVPIYDESGQLVAVEGIARDITRRHRMEEELRKALEHERELNELKMRFTSMVSHEFRTPLAVIQTATDLVKRYGSKMPTERQQEHLEDVHRQVRHLVSLLDDILAIGRSETRVLQLSTALVNLPSLCQQLVYEIQQTAQTHHIRLDYHDCAQEALIDSNLMRRAVGNLLSNAVKYSPQGSTVVLDLRCSEREAIFTVRDEGIGIPESDQAYLFTAFQRASNVQQVSGTGLGLAIVKHAVDLHGGTVALDSRLGEGTTVTLKIPI